MNNNENRKIRYYDSFSDFLQRIREEFGDLPAISEYSRRGEERLFSFRQFADRCQALAAVFTEAGYQGRHMAIVAENSVEWAAVYFAITASGNVAVCIDAEQSDESLREMMRMADVQTAFVSESCLKVGEEMRRQGELEELYCISDETSQEKLQEKGKAVLEKAGDKSYGFPGLDPDQVAVIAFTSGTTSVSKMVMLSHKNLLVNAGDSIYDVDAGPKVFSSLPCYHTYGMTSALIATLGRGAHLCLNGDLRTFMRDMVLSRPYSMLTVPLIIEAIHKQIWAGAEKEGKAEAFRKLIGAGIKKRKNGVLEPSPILEKVWKDTFGDLKLIISGGAHLSTQIQEEFEMFGVEMLEGYGITECSPMISVNGNHHKRMGSVGQALPHCQVRIVDEEIQVRGLNVMKGYYKDPEQTGLVMDGEWFCTGDLGYIDKDGYIFITGRKKNLIVFKNGKKVSPEKLEEIILRIPMVKEVMVYGTSKGVSADDVSVAASIYPDPDMTKDMSVYEILDVLQRRIDEINESLPLYQQIQMVNIREQEFKKTASKKIKRYLV